MNGKFLYLLFLIPIISQAQVNRALIVVIDAYPSQSGWEEIHAVNDTLILIPMLNKQGYLRKNIKVLSNKNATKEAIIQSFSELHRNSRKGDYVYIHFSCHGQQMADDNGDEADGLDEALIPFDAKRRYTKGEYEGENHFRDDELEKLLERLRTKISPTGHITVALDACHSGTGTRTEDEEEYIRGTSYIFGPEESTGKHNSGTDNYRLSHSVDKNLSPITVFSACLDKEVNHEHKDAESGQYYGSLSYALCKIFSSGLNQLSTGQVYLMLKNEMKELFIHKKWSQTPYYESTLTNKAFKLGR